MNSKLSQVNLKRGAQEKTPQRKQFVSLASLKDRELLDQTKQLVQREREVLTKVLHHLREVERRRLFSDLGYQSLFEYGVKELKYSEGQAGRRLQAMRLIKEVPQVEAKIQSGVLSLSNVSQAQSFFREAKREKKPVTVAEKIAVLDQLENKSAREGQKLLLSLAPEQALPKEKERQLTPTHVEMRFVLSDDLRAQLEQVRSLLGPAGASMSLAELIAQMAQLSVKQLKVKRFGRKRTQTSASPTSELKVSISKSSSRNPRHIHPGVKHHVWMRDQGKCTKCGGTRNLNYDHVLPVALGGKSSPANLRLLCFQCNQRQAIKTFGGSGQIGLRSETI